MGIKAVDERSLLQLGAQARLSLVGQRCGMANAIYSGGMGQKYTSLHMRHLCPNGADAIQLVYPGFTNNPYGQGESSLPVSMFQARVNDPVTISGGSGFAAGDTFTMAVTSGTGMAAATAMVTAVSSGVPASAVVVDGGLYNTIPSTTPASTSGSGSVSGMTATFNWLPGVAGLHIGIEPVWGTLTTVMGGSGAVVPVGKGLKYDTSLNYHLLVPCGDFLVTDLIPVDVPVGGAIGIRTSMGCTTPVYGRTIITSTTAPNAPSANYESNNGGTTFSDLSVSGSFNGTNAFPDGYEPILILGIPKQQSPTVIAVGDSRCWENSTGANSITIGGYSTAIDVADNDGNYSWFEKALSLTTSHCYWPWSNLSMQGDQLAHFLSANFSSSYMGGMGRLKAIGMAKPTAVYMGLNINDFGNGVTLANMQKYEQEMIGLLRGLGVKYVFTDTTDPDTTSTDSWATTTNQTQASCSGNIIARNEALAAGTWAAYDFFIDQRPNSESSINSGLWAVNGTAGWGTGDGLHASPQIVTLKAATAAAAIAANISL